MERTDNLRVIDIADKKNVLRDIIDGKRNVDGIMSVDVVEYTVFDVSGLPMSDVVSESNDNRYVWLYKVHD